MAGVLDGVDMRTQLAGQNRLELLLFRLVGRLRFGINVFKVQEVIQCPPLTQIPNSHPSIRGVANMRGKTITVLDLSEAIGGRPIPDWKEKFIIVTEYNRQTQGFLVEAVDRIVNMNWEDIVPPPKSARDSYLTAVTRIDDELIEIIDVEKIMHEIMGVSEEMHRGDETDHIALEDQHVLVADDSLVARKQVKTVLDHLGVSCTLVNDGQEAFDQLKQWLSEGKDLHNWLATVISDVEMPKMDGYSLTSKIRATPGLDHLHVILHTSLSGVFNHAMVDKVGANDFIAKFEADELALSIKERLEEHQRQRG